jgi:hypothetical protein
MFGPSAQRLARARGTPKRLKAERNSHRRQRSPTLSAMTPLKVSPTIARSSSSVNPATNSRVGGGKPAFAPVISHPVLHVSTNTQIRSRLRGTEQNESSFAVLRKIADRIARVKISGFEQLAGAREAAPLVANRRQRDSRLLSRVPDVFPCAHLDCARTARCYECDLENFRSG